MNQNNTPELKQPAPAWEREVILEILDGDHSSWYDHNSVTPKIIKKIHKLLATERAKWIAQTREEINGLFTYGDTYHYHFNHSLEIALSVPSLTPPKETV